MLNCGSVEVLDDALRLDLHTALQDATFTIGGVVQDLYTAAATHGGPLLPYVQSNVSLSQQSSRCHTSERIVSEQ